jgi:adenylate cyclase
LIDEHRYAALVRLAQYRLTRRDLRLGSGLILFTYIAAHLTNHALGLVSINLAEGGLRVAVAIWHSAIGTTLLYGAAAIHLTLAMVAVYERRTLRMPWAEALRIALGLAMPLLLIGHFTTTRVGFELYGLDPDYHRVVRALWSSDSEGRQLALLAPGWLHGCFGLNFAFGRRLLYRRIRRLLFASAILLPILAAVGFLEMAREIGVLRAGHFAIAANLATTVSGEQNALAHVRDGLLAAYVGVVILVVLARSARALIEQYRPGFITIAYPQRLVGVPRGWSVLEASRAFGIPHRAGCAGRGRCSTCRVRVTDGAERCPPPGDDELRTLERIRASSDVRLACQLRPEGDVAVVPLLRPLHPQNADYSRA